LLQDAVEIAGDSDFDLHLTGEGRRFLVNLGMCFFVFVACPKIICRFYKKAQNEKNKNILYVISRTKKPSFAKVVVGMKQVCSCPRTLTMPALELNRTRRFSFPSCRRIIRGELIGSIESTLACPGTKLDHMTFFSVRRKELSLFLS
jgi:hypothetical protein